MSAHEAWMVAAAGIVLTWGAAWLVRRLMLSYGAALAKRTRHHLDDVVAAKLATPLALAIAWTGTLLLLEPALTREEHLLVVSRALPSGLVVIGGFALARGVMASFAGHMGHRHSRALLLAGRFAGVLVAILVTLTLFAVWDVNVTPLLASAGIVGIALALAAQETLANLFAGIAIYMDRVYRVGDWIVLDHGRSERLRGQVVDIGLRSTRLRTRDDVVIVVPNTDIANARILNQSAQTQGHRARLSVIVAYGSELDRVEEALMRAARTAEDILPVPTPRVRFREFRPEGIRVELMAWVADARLRGRAIHGLLKTAYHELAADDIEIPRVHSLYELTPAGAARSRGRRGGAA